MKAQRSHVSDIAKIVPCAAARLGVQINKMVLVLKIEEVLESSGSLAFRKEH